MFGIHDLMHSEVDAANSTDHYLGALVRNYPSLIDCLLKLPYFIETGKGETSPEAFHFFARTHYLQAPYTFWSLYRVWRTGHYLEPSILVRYLYEVVIQLRFFQKNPQQLDQHLPPKRGVQLRTMFDEFSPGFYKDYYGNLLSTIAHGKTGPIFFRLDPSQPERIRMGCEYNAEAASMVMNQTLALLFSFFNLFELYFPNNSLASNTDVQAEVAEAINWLENAMAYHKSGFPTTAEWYSLIDRFIRA